MIATEFLKNQVVLHTPKLRLEQLCNKHFEALFAGINDLETRRLTGTHTIFTPEIVQTFLTGLPSRDDRADWAIIRESDGAFIGEVVLNDLDEDNQSMNFRIGLQSQYLGQGYGTQATRAVVDYGFNMVKLHRIHLGVYAFNPRAERVYKKCGFLREGIERDALFWDGQWVDSIRMAILSTSPRASL
jgi:RimJ/RimL family protein N-acetyltransferase